MVALGTGITGAMGNDDALVRELIAAGDATGEPIWQLPLHQDYRPLIDSSVADIKNIGDRWGGAITAAGSWRSSSATRRGATSTSPGRRSTTGAPT